MSNNIRVFLVDDHAIVRSGIANLIEHSDGITVCGQAGSLKEAYVNIKSSKPDIVLLDIKLPDGDGASGCREIKKQNPSVRVMILSAFAEDSIVLEAIKAGADGYLLKSVASENIITGLKDVAANKPALDPIIVSKIMSSVKNKQPQDEFLSPQEQEIIELVSQGKTNREISEVLVLSEKNCSE